MFVEANLRDDQEIKYNNWSIMKHIGEKDLRTPGDRLIKCDPSLKMGKAYPPCINNEKKETLHSTLRFENDEIHIYFVYVHPISDIEATISIKSAQYKYSLIFEDFNGTQ